MIQISWMGGFCKLYSSFRFSWMGGFLSSHVTCSVYRNLNVSSFCFALYYFTRKLHGAGVPHSHRAHEFVDAL
jgi:hypothetical protein